MLPIAQLYKTVIYIFTFYPLSKVDVKAIQKDIHYAAYWDVSVSVNFTDSYYMWKSDVLGFMSGFNWNWPEHVRNNTIHKCMGWLQKCRLGLCDPTLPVYHLYLSVQVGYGSFLFVVQLPHYCPIVLPCLDRTRKIEYVDMSWPY